ncbi:sensor domain-containing phosphodiesterase [Vibrio neptunius]|uniref:EAL domain-containing protein n=1 Tax=Vibrio neptunius TaxID=170651 RepID=A0ABS2ZXE9_9VIBR|nr:EAL domain-containing protein [Vibrio neptunius]MBN3492307.1 EAL domain-containing protein [Vibrio neptunius]MBN3514878.1 EAL domain-containing protein [Vibrio neptunius]MBN3549687.1 EAL domain-containing protein [Vibrio neptunius]MBN3576932.1 EAL domain-containing protein [Vibrio neptunius]MCH9870596.1 EAL domain-containing protein [Vibrio neptunius]
MSKINTTNLVIPDEMTSGWQNIVDLLAKIVSVPAALVMRIYPKHIEVYSSNNNGQHPYRVGDSETLGQGLYCETVVNKQSQLIVPNAEIDLQWQNNPDIKFGMLAYCGVPINWPNGDTFGTICVLDNKENHFSETYQQLIESFRDSIESQLKTLYQNEKLKHLNLELKSRVHTRTQDLVDLNYSLNQEIDKRRAAEQKIRYQQRHDLGTGFLNRSALEHEADHFIKDVGISPSLQAAAIHIGFTNGRRIQSKYGYSSWETVLVQFSKRLGDLSQYQLLTSRPTSTDLVLLLESSELDNDLGSLCHQLVEISQSEFDIDGDKLHLNAYIGISTTKDTLCPKSLLKYASEAMQSCKDSGHKFSYYSQAIADIQKHINQMESYLLQAVRNDDLLLYFQPKVSPMTHKWTGAEALLRWRHPILGDISNETLIHMAEQNGLIFEVGSFVLRAAIQKAADWMTLVEDFKIAVNVSAIQLKNPNFIDQIEDLLNAYQLPAKFLELEITESGLIADEAIALNTLTGLNRLGVTLSLDDFGTGYSSFNYLKKFPFDAIKVDKSFVQQLDESEEDKEIVRSIIHVAKKLNLAVTVEGIESATQENFIISEGCEYGQGYFYGKPMPCDEFETSLLSQNYPGSTNITYQ